MQILSINSFNYTAFGKDKGSTGVGISAPRFGLTIAKPLLNDTVSFKSNKLANKSEEINKTTARLVRTKMLEPSKRVFKLINNLFDDLLATEKYPKNPLVSIDYRLKSEDSIAEKSGSAELKTAEEIIAHMTDIIGAKLVLRTDNKISIDAVLDRFIPLLKSGKLELLEIENKRPIAVKGSPEREACKYDYPSIDCLNKLADIQDEAAKKGGSKQKVKRVLFDDFTKANYCGTHFLFRIPGKKPAVFELQLIGDNVNKAKKVDDMAYKFLNGKEPKDSTLEIDKIFEPFTNPHFFDAESDKECILENAHKKINKYRGDVFLFQRTKAAQPYSKKKQQEMFLPISERLFPSDIELKYGISSLDFDYNNLYRLMQKKK